MIRVRSPHIAVTLLEMMVTVALFGVVSLIGLAAFIYSVRVWKNVSDREAAIAALRKVHLRLEGDLLTSRRSEVQFQACPSSLGGGPDGDAIWCLSARDAEGNFLRSSLGEPLWQRNVLYYVTIPNPLTSVTPLALVGGPGPDGYEDHCPYKVLVRKVIDTGTTLGLHSESEPEELLTHPLPYLTRPAGLSTSAMLTEPGVESAEIVALHLLTFRVRPQTAGLEFDVRALRRYEGEKTLALGSLSLSENPLTLQGRFSIQPRN